MGQRPSGPLHMPAPLVPPTFHQGEEAVHLHAASGMGDAQGAAGNQALLGGAPFRGADQTPARPLAGPLQQLHRLAHLDGQLAAVARIEVLEDHGQLTSARELGVGHGVKCERWKEEMVGQRGREKGCMQRRRGGEEDKGERWDPEWNEGRRWKRELGTGKKTRK